MSLNGWLSAYERNSNIWNKNYNLLTYDEYIYAHLLHYEAIKLCMYNEHPKLFGNISKLQQQHLTYSDYYKSLTIAAKIEKKHRTHNFG